MMNIKNLDANNIKINEKLPKNIFDYYFGYVTVKELRFVTINSVNPLYLIINKIYGYIEDRNGNK